MNFLKFVLQSSTPNCMVYRETGQFHLIIFIKVLFSRVPQQKRLDPLLYKPQWKREKPSLNREKGVTETESITSVLKNVPQIIMAARTSTPFFQRWLFLWHPGHQSCRSIKQVIQSYLSTGKDVFLQSKYWVIIKYYWLKKK